MEKKEFQYCELSSSITLTYEEETVTARKGSELYDRIKLAIKNNDLKEVRNIVNKGKTNKIKQYLKF